MKGMEDLIKVQEQILTAQKILIKQNIEAQQVRLWSEYGEELERIKQDKVKDIEEGGRVEQVLVFLLNLFLEVHDAQESLSISSKEERKFFERNFALWMNLPAMKKMWKRVRLWKHKEHVKFVDSLIKK